jgi:hypothetical protein
MHCLNLPNTETQFRFYKKFNLKSKVRFTFWNDKKGNNRELYCNNSQEVLKEFKKAKRHYEKSI